MHWTVLSKLIIFWIVMALSEDFTVGALKCRFNDKQHETS